MPDRAAGALIWEDVDRYLLFREDRLVYVGQSWNCFLAVTEQTRKDRAKLFDSWGFIKELDEHARRTRAAALIAGRSPEYSGSPLALPRSRRRPSARLGRGVALEAYGGVWSITSSAVCPSIDARGHE